MSTAYLEIRSQHSVGGTNGFGGPDTYVCVQVVPDESVKLTVLNRKVAKIRGIKLKYFGEGYKDRQKTTRSMLGEAIYNARKFVIEYNQLQERREKLSCQIEKMMEDY